MEEKQIEQAEENDYVYVRFRMKKANFTVFQNEADEINEKYNTKESGTSRIKALADDNANVKMHSLIYKRLMSQQESRYMTLLEK